MIQVKGEESRIGGGGRRREKVGQEGAEREREGEREGEKKEEK